MSTSKKQAIKTIIDDHQLQLTGATHVEAALEAAYEAGERAGAAYHDEQTRLREKHGLTNPYG